MADLKLGSDEYVVFSIQNALYGEGLVKKLHNITLTNKRIILSKVGAFGKDKVVLEKRISDVRVYQDAAQVQVSTVGGTQTKVDVYLSSGQLSFSLSGAGHSDAVQFANSLNHVVTDTEVDIFSDTGNDTGAKAFKNALFGMNSVGAKKKKNKKVAIRCTSCGASFEGIEGGTAKCPYCGSYFNT